MDYSGAVLEIPRLPDPQPQNRALGSYLTHPPDSTHGRTIPSKETGRRNSKHECEHVGCQSTERGIESPITLCVEPARHLGHFQCAPMATIRMFGCLVVLRVPNGIILVFTLQGAVVPPQGKLSSDTQLLQLQHCVSTDTRICICEFALLSVFHF
ncbi:hypothetical protein EMCRGX_G028900 [Ephydatia muelleri]